jgi:TetR/AcrR family transcriptional regulator
MTTMTGIGERTRSAILDASRQLFLERGYAGTPINAITEACGISRAGFYTYFKDKREVFSVLGETAYHDLLSVVNEWESVSEPLPPADVQRWVGDYFAHMDRHGAFIMAAWHSAPVDEEFRRGRDRMVNRAAWALGRVLRGAGEHSPEVVGVVAMGLLDRAWHALQTQTVPVDRDEVIAVVAEVIFAMTDHHPRPSSPVSGVL